MLNMIQWLLCTVTAPDHACVVLIRCQPQLMVGGSLMEDSPYAQFFLCLGLCLCSIFSNMTFDISKEKGRGNSIMVNICVCQAGRPGLSQVRSACFRKVVCYQNVMNYSLHKCRRLFHQRPSMCYYVYVIMHVKDPQLSVVRVRHCVSCLQAPVCPYMAFMH